MRIPYQRYQQHWVIGKVVQTLFPNELQEYTKVLPSRPTPPNNPTRKEAEAYKKALKDYQEKSEAYWKEQNDFIEAVRKRGDKFLAKLKGQLRQKLKESGRDITDEELNYEYRAMLTGMLADVRKFPILTPLSRVFGCEPVIGDGLLLDLPDPPAPIAVAEQ